MAMLVARKPHRIDTLAKFLLGAATVLCLIAFWEYRLQRLPWVGHIPSFLQVADPVVARMLSGARRSADGLYRVLPTYNSDERRVGQECVSTYRSRCLPYHYQQYIHIIYLIDRSTILI